MLFVFAIVEDENVEAAFGEEELVGVVHDALSAEVPEVELNGLIAFRKPPRFDVDAGGFGFVGIKGVFGEAIEE